jgi:hypothetical protein
MPKTCREEKCGNKSNEEGFSFAFFSEHFASKEKYSEHCENSEECGGDAEHPWLRSDSRSKKSLKKKKATLLQRLEKSLKISTILTYNHI